MSCITKDFSKTSLSSPIAIKALRRALTVIEIIIVLLILAIAASVATPRLSSALESYRLESATRRLLLDLELARSHARSTGRDVTISFDVANDRYTLSNIHSLDRRNQTYFVDLAATPYFCRIVQVDFVEVDVDTHDGPSGELQANAMQSGSFEVVFDRFENPDKGGTIVLQIGASTKTILIDGNDGEISLL